MMSENRYELNKNLAQMLKGGVIMDVTTPEQARIAQEAGACAVMALERIPADIRAAGGVSRMSDPKMIRGIQEAVSIPVMAKCRIGHFVEAQILEAIEIDYIDESEVLSPADDIYHINKKEFKVPFVCGARDLGEALRRIAEGASMIRTKGEPGTGDVVQAVRHMRAMNAEIRRIQKATGITTVFVTHDQEEALTLSDRIAVFNKGVIEQIGTPNEVYNHSATEFVCNFIGDINRLETPLVQHLNDRGAGLDPAKHNYIRLERLHVNVEPRDGELALSGVVESREYYGLYIKYYITVEGQTLKVIEKNDGVNIYEPAQQVSVVINPAHVMAYEAGEEAAHA